MLNSLGSGLLSAREGEAIALRLAEVNGCVYCAAAHTQKARAAGLNDEQILALRRGQADEPRVQAMIDLAEAVNAECGFDTEPQVEAAREAGLSDGEIVEVVAHVALNLYTNMINHVADTDVDFPPAPEL
jgi:uncharacterized peroxidase-related enzyme